jgi:asparagine synthase (glutamine-hydrolysing)
MDFFRRRMWGTLRRGVTLPPIVRQVRDNGLTYLGPKALTELYECVRRVETDSLPGILIEAGCALGGSAIVIASAKARARPLHVFDTFAMIPAPSASDGDDARERYRVIASGKSKGIRGGEYYGYRQNLYEEVVHNFERHGLPVHENNVHFIKGLFEDVLHVSEPVALAHIDGDWYRSVMTCLRRIEPNLVPRGTLVIDDYRAWSGCKRAVDEYFADKAGSYIFRAMSRLHIVKK